MKKEIKKVLKKKQEVTLGGLSEKVDNLAGTVSTLSETVDNLAGTVGSLSETVDNLAIMVAGGFERIDMRFFQLEKKFDDCCDRIEYILLRSQDNRIERLEDNMRLVKTALEMV